MPIRGYKEEQTNAGDRAVFISNELKKRGYNPENFPDIISWMSGQTFDYKVSVGQDIGSQRVSRDLAEALNEILPLTKETSEQASKETDNTYLRKYVWKNDWLIRCEEKK